MRRVVLIMFLIMASTLVMADVLLIEQVRQAGDMTVPVNGQTMAEVEGAFGAPQHKGSPIGDPPITRWEYEHWSVYFEYDRVLFTVLNKGEVVVHDTASG